MEISLRLSIIGTIFPSDSFLMFRLQSVLHCKAIFHVSLLMLLFTLFHPVCHYPSKIRIHKMCVLYFWFTASTFTSSLLNQRLFRRLILEHLSRFCVCLLSETCVSFGCTIYPFPGTCHSQADRSANFRHSFSVKDELICK